MRPLNTMKCGGWPSMHGDKDGWKRMAPQIWATEYGEWKLETESAAKISNCRLCFVRRWDLRRQIQSSLRTTRSPCFTYVPALPALRHRTCCRFAPPERTSCGGPLPASLARAGSASPCYELVMCTRTQCVSKSLERTRANVGPQVGVVLDVRATRPLHCHIAVGLL